MDKHSTITVRENGEKKKVRIGSELKPEIISSVIQKWQSVIDITAKIMHVPSGLIMKLHEDTIEVLVKSQTEGNPYKAGEKADLIYGLYCETVIGTQKPLLIPDATKNKIWRKNNPDVDIHMISYLGMPINWPDGEVFGTVCMLDNKENHYSKDYLDLLNQVKIQIETDLQLLIANKKLSGQNRELKQKIKSNKAIKNTDKRFRIIFENSLAVMLLIDPDTHKIVAANNAAAKFYGWKRSEIEKMSIGDINTLSPGEIKTEMEKARKSERIYFRFKHRLANGSIRNVEVYSGKIEIDKKDYLHSIIHDVTEQAEAEEALKTNEKTLRIFVEHSPAAIAMFDTQMRYMVYSHRFLEDYDLGERNITGLSHYEVFPEIPQRWKEIHQQGLNGKILSADNDPFTRANGKMDWIRWEIHPWYKNENEIGGIILFSEVITDRKKAEEALSHSHDLMKYIIEHNQSAVAVHDRDLNYIFVSQRYLDDYRVREKDIIGKHHYEVFPDIPDKWKKVHQKALKGIVSSADNDIFYREDGTYDWTRWECRPWYDADGEIGGIIIYTEVINEQKQREQEIVQLNQRLEILISAVKNLSSTQSLETVQDIVAQSARKLIDSDGATLVFKDKNQCFYANEDAIQPLWKGEKFPMHSCISGWVMQNNTSVVIEDVFSDARILKNIYSSTFVKSLAMVPVNIKNPIGAIGNYWKETYHPSETELQLLQTLADAAARAIENINLYAEMEKRVKERTGQLQAVNKELETFTYSVSHDLKAPLRGIDGYSKLLLEEYGNSLNEEAAYFIKTIRTSTRQMNQLIDDLLSYSRLERSQFKKEKIDVKTFVEQIVGSYSEEFQKKGVSLKTQVPDKQITADPTGVSIALRNFIENALKFTTKNKKSAIEIGVQEKTESWMAFVKDNGTGFDMKYHDRIFEIFQRLHRAEDFPGTGIGLAMVTKALQRMEGRAWAESAPGKGSTFFIEIPK